jgi:hypothetical protein
MKRTYLTILFSLTLLFPFGRAFAQVPDELETFQQASEDHSVLFRGRQATKITFPANGNPYWEQPLFQLGDIVFEDNLYRDVFLNIDAREQRALVTKALGLMAVALPPSLTPSLIIGDRHFVGIGPGEALSEGFYEVFGSGPEQVYKHVEKVLNESVNDVNGREIGYYDENYRSDVYRFFALRTSYYFRDAEGEFSRIKSRSSLLRMFPSAKRKEIRKAVKAAGIGSSKANFDAYCKAVLNAAAQ